MRLTVRLYKRHDLDLLFLYCLQNQDFDIKTDFKDTVKNYIHNKPFRHKEIPCGLCRSVANMPSFVQFHINLDDKKDKDLISWTREITKGRRNNIIKNIYRSSYPVIDLPYKNESENKTMEVK